MIGYYVHHVGVGHLRRAQAVAEALGEPVTGFSSLDAPPGWEGPWIRLERDDAELEPRDRTAHQRLHWVPLGDAGLRSRMGEIASWLRHVAPQAFVVDVSVEVATLVRLHGIPVVSMVVPGERDDPAHHLGFDLSDALVGCWPPTATQMLRGVPPYLLDRVQPVGALSRFPVAEPAPRRPGPRRVAVLAEPGSAGLPLDDEELELARKETPGWEWTVLGDAVGTAVEDVFEALRDADVVITHGGQDALAEVAAARTPAVIVPRELPHQEQQVTADALWHGGWPVVLVDAWPTSGWAERLERAAALDGEDWASWCDGQAAGRIAEIVRSVALPPWE